MCRARETRPWFEINLVVIEGTGRQHNASGGYKITGKANNWMELVRTPTYT
jgi:hypothetical protein